MKKVILLMMLCSVFTIASHNASAQNTGSAFKRSILKYTNQFRVSKRLAPLKMTDAISEPAQKHSDDMASKRVGFGHEGFQNRTKALEKQMGHSIATAENVAYGTLTAKQVVKIWQNSPVHRKNLLGNYNKVGIGIAKDRNNVLYFTQLFVRDN